MCRIGNREVAAAFHAADANKNGTIDHDEFEALWKGLTGTRSFQGDQMTWATGADDEFDDIYEMGDDKYTLVGRGGRGVFFPFHQGIQCFELCIMIVLISTVYTTPMVRRHRHPITQKREGTVFVLLRVMFKRLSLSYDLEH